MTKHFAALHPHELDRQIQSEVGYKNCCYWGIVGAFVLGLMLWLPLAFSLPEPEFAPWGAELLAGAGVLLWLIGVILRIEFGRANKNIEHLIQQAARIRSLPNTG